VSAFFLNIKTTKSASEKNVEKISLEDKNIFSCCWHASFNILLTITACKIG
jgi:hypothetical protein